MPDPLHCHYFVKGEYLLWGVRSFHIPPLVTTGSAADAVPGAIGQPHTQILLGNSDLGGGLRSGFRLTAGGWFDMWEECGVEASGFYLGEKTNHFNTSTAQNPVIARPRQPDPGFRSLPVRRFGAGVQGPDQFLFGGVRTERQRHHQPDL